MRKIQVGARVDREIDRQLDALATSTGQTKSALIEDALSKYLGGRGSGGRMRSQLHQLTQQMAQLQGEVARLGAMIGPRG